MNSAIYSEGFLSIKIKITMQIELFILMIVQTLIKVESTDMQWLAWLQIFLLMQLSLNLIYQKLMIDLMTEQKEQNELSFQTMHDLRNYVQSICEYQKDMGNLTTLINEHNYSSSQQKSNNLENGGRLSVEAQIEKLSSKQSSRRNSSNNNDKSVDINLQIELLRFKIIFLQHIQLIMNNNQIFKIDQVDSIELVKKLNNTINNLNIQKNNSIQIQFNSQSKSVTIEPTIFEYMLVIFSKILHDQNHLDLIINIFFGSFQDTNYLKFQIKSKKDISPNLLNEILNSHIIIKLIESLYEKNDQEIYTKKDIIFVNINYSSIKIIESDIESPNKIFAINSSKESLNIPLDTHTENNLLNLNNNISHNLNLQSSIPRQRKSFTRENLDGQLSTECNIEQNLSINNTIWINVDDEHNIQRMNKRVFSKSNLTLSICNDKPEFLSLIGKIFGDQQNQKNKPKSDCNEDNNKININENYENENSFSHESISSEKIDDGDSDSPVLVCVMDHMLDREEGWEVIRDAIEFNKLTKFIIHFILLSSTEDKYTYSKQEELGVRIFVTKPLTKNKLQRVTDCINDNLNNQDQNLQFIN